MHLAAGIALAVSLVLNGGTGAEAQAVTLTLPQASSPKEFVESYFADIPIMIDIAYCESRFRHYDKDGSVFRGKVNDADIGIMQVNEYYHAKTAGMLGIDFYTMEGNVSYARYLYEKQGTQPWSSSEPCWGKSKKAPTNFVALQAN